MRLLSVLVLGPLACAWGLPLKTDFPEEGELIEGDIIVDPDQYIREERNLVASEHSLWPDGILYYDFSSEFNETQQKVVEGALEDLEQCTCVRFKRRSIQDTYIHLRNTRNGCASSVGFHPTGSGINLFLSYPGCQRQGTIQHEFLHALGFWHEHTRPDRDNFVTVHWDNIAPGLESNFKKRPESEVQYQQMPYDYDSVMHYRPVAFSKDHQSLTLEPRDAAAVQRMGQRIRFSAVDLAKLNRLYNCSSPPYYRGNDLIVKFPGQQLLLDSICKKITMKSDQNIKETSGVLKKPIIKHENQPNEEVHRTQVKLKMHSQALLRLPKKTTKVKNVMCNLKIN